jgi:hypothetical protein
MQKHNNTKKQDVVSPPKVNNFAIKNLNISEENEISNNELKN